MNYTNELVVDNFAGGGGASTGIEIAIGRSVDIAINHDPAAIAMHKVNHPTTKHYCESVWDVDPVEACAGRPVALAWFSPDCKHFSKAKGGKPVDKNIRGLAWIVLRWAALVKPRVIMLENVEEFKTWGPVRHGKPVKARSGETFMRWVEQLRALGYVVEWRELRACDYGAPTIRKRLFVVARCDGQPIIWPEPTHGAPDSSLVKAGVLEPWRTAAEIIDWSKPCPSIFERKRPLAENTMKRIARGIMKYVVNDADPFIVKCNHTTNKGVYDCFRGQSIEEPLQTITAAPGFGVVVPTITRFNQNGVGQSVEEPLDTVMAGAARFGLVAPVMSPIAQTGFSEDRSYRADEPLRTVVSKAEQCVVAPVLVKYHGLKSNGDTRGQHMDEPINTLDTANRFALVSAFIAKHYSGGYQSAGAAPDDPLPTITTQDHNALCTAHIIKMKGTNTGQSMEEPLQTITASGTHFGEVRAFLTKYYGQGTGQKVDKPLDTVTSHDTFALVMIHGTPYAIVDIGMRMLEPRELFNAQGFPEDYVIDVDAEGKPITKKSQVARCGNAVCPPIPAVLVRVNLPELCDKKEVAS